MRLLLRLLLLLRWLYWMGNDGNWNFRSGRTDHVGRIRGDDGRMLLVVNTLLVLQLRYGVVGLNKRSDGISGNGMRLGTDLGV